MNHSEMNIYFLVRHDNHHGNIDTEGEDPDGAVRYFKDNGFTCAAGYWGCPWYFVDIRKKIFKPGRPGVSYGYEIGNHAITLDEFKTIYNIYKKYEGLSLMSMEPDETQI